MKTAVSETSIQAFHANQSASAVQRNRILGFIVARGGDWSIGEVAQALNLQKSTVSARINELIYDFKALESRPVRKDRISGISVRPVAPPPMQKELFQ